MFDSDSTSEQNSTFAQFSLESEGESRIIQEVETEQLVEKNASLVKENNILRSQFEKAVKNSEQINELQQQNTQLLSKIREINLEKDDLTKRLDLSLKAQNDANAKLELEKKAKSQLKTDCEATLQTEVKKTKTIFRTQLASLYEQVQQLQASKEQDDINMKLVQCKINKCLEAAKKYFQIKITDIDTLTETLSNNIPQTNVPQYQQQAIYQDQKKKVNFLIDSDSDYKEKISKTKAALKQTVEKLHDLEEENLALKKQLNQNEFRQRQSIQQYEEKINTLNDTLKNETDERNRIVQALNNKIDFLNNKLSKQQVQQKPVENIQSSQIIQTLTPKPAPPQISNVEKDMFKLQISNLEKTNFDLSNTIDILKKDLKSEQKQKERLNQSLKDAESAKAAAVKQVAQKENELSSLQTVHNESVKEIETLRIAINNLKNNNKQKQFNTIVKKEMKKSKAQITQLEADNAAIKRQATEAENEKLKMESVVQSQKEEIERLHNENEQLNDTISKLNSELVDAKFKYDRKPQVTEEDVMPNSAWYYSEFTDGLRKSISVIAENPSLRPPSKAQAIYKAICSYMNKQIKSREKAIDDLMSQQEDKREFFSNFIVSLSIAATGSPITYDMFESANGAAMILEAIQDLKKSNVDVTRQLELLHSYTDLFNSKFGIDDTRDLTSMSQQVNLVAEHISKQISEGKKYKKLCQEMREKVTNTQGVIDKATRQTESALESLKGEYELLQQKNNNVQNKLTSLQRENQNLKTEKSQLKDTVAALQSELELVNTDMSDIKQNENKIIENAIHSYKESVENEIRSLNQTISELRAQITQLNSTHDMEKSKLTEKIKDLESANEEMEDQIHCLSNKREDEKQTTTNSYENAISDIKAQCEAQRKDIENLSHQLSEAEKRNKSEKLTILKLKKEKTIAEREIQKLKDETEREKKLQDSQMKAAIVTAESAANAKIGEASARFDREKKRIISFVMNEFSSFAPSSPALDENNMKNVVYCAKEKLEKLTKCDDCIRRIVNASDGQSTDEAVAQLMLGN